MPSRTRATRPLPISTLRLWLTLAAAAASHGLLDMLTNGGLGIALLSPLSTTRLFFPITPIEVSPLYPSDFLSPWGLRVLANESLWILLPTAALLAAVELARYLCRPRRHPEPEGLNVNSRGRSPR